MARALILLALLAGLPARAGSVRKESVSVVAVRDDQLWMLTYKGADPWAPGQEIFLGIPVAGGKPSPIGSFVVEYDRGQNRFQVKLTKKMGAFRRGKAGEQLVAVFKANEKRDPAAVEESETDEERPAKPVKGSDRMNKRLGISAGVGEPLGTLGGGGVHYNLFDFLTVSGHFGLAPLGLVKTLGASGGVRLYLPNWSLTPFIHPSVAFLKISVDVTQVVGDVSFFGTVVENGQSFLFFNVPFGVAWQAGNGFAAEAFVNVLALTTFRGIKGLAFGGHLAWFF